MGDGHPWRRDDPVMMWWGPMMFLPASAPATRSGDQRGLLRARKLLDRILARQGLPHGPKRFLIHQLNRTPARGVLRAPAVVVRPLARTRIPRIARVQRAIRAANDVDEVHCGSLPLPPGTVQQRRGVVQYGLPFVF